MAAATPYLLLMDLVAQEAVEKRVAHNHLLLVLVVMELLIQAVAAAAHTIAATKQATAVPAS